MKKYLTLFMVVMASSSLAKHYFNLCYYNWTNKHIGYNNGSDNTLGNKISKDSFKNRGTIVGSGEISPNKNKCFKAVDETIFFSHKLSFVINNQLLSIIDPPFSKPYVVSQNNLGKYISKSGKGKLLNTVDHGGHDQYYLNVHVIKDGEVVLSSSSDPNNANAYIIPAIK
ncbi:MAG: hypothetical protein ACK5Z5_01935 [Neisseriaceae bacterium]